MMHSDTPYTEMPRDDQVDLDPPVNVVSSQAVPDVVRTLCGRLVLWWTYRTKLEKALCCTLTLLSIFLIGLLIHIASVTHKPIYVVDLSSKAGVCLEPECIRSSSEILDLIDFSSDPCDDFYQFSCGLWPKKYALPRGKSSWGQFSVLSDRNLLILKNQLESPSKKDEITSVTKVKTFYKSCIDSEGNIERLGSSPLETLVNSIFGGWKSFSSNTAGDELSGYDLIEDLTLVHKSGLGNPLFSFSVSSDARNSSNHILELEQGGLSFSSRRYYHYDNGSFDIHTDPLIVGYQQLMLDTFSLTSFSKDIDRSVPSAIFNHSLDFERKLANISLSRVELRNMEKSYEKTTLGDLNSRFSFLNWTTFANRISSQYNISLTDDEPIVVYGSSYFTELDKLFSEALESRTQKRALYYYIRWHFIKSLTLLLSNNFRDAIYKWEKLYTGVEGREDRWKICVREAESGFSLVIGRLFAELAFRDSSRTATEDMVQQIRSSFMAAVKTADWMDDETRAAALDKAAKVVDFIGYPDLIYNDTAIDSDDHYGLLEIKEDEFFWNNIRTVQLGNKKSWEKLRKPVDKTLWDMSAAAVNAYYNPAANEMVFPAGILQPPFFSTKRPMSMNFGGIGIVLGHELSHGFDNSGRQFDVNGNLRNWWSNSSLKRFTDKSQCFVKQYSSYNIFGHQARFQLRGALNLGENIADNGGIKAAYHAHQKWKRSNNDIRLPGLNFTDGQLFFLSFSQLWCDIATKTSILRSIAEDAHSIAKYRVIGSLSNFEEFAKVFRCPKNSGMNPVRDRCVLW